MNDEKSNIFNYNNFQKYYFSQFFLLSFNVNNRKNMYFTRWNSVRYYTFDNSR